VDNAYRLHLMGLGLDQELESAYRGMLRQPNCSLPELARSSRSTPRRRPV